MTAPLRRGRSSSSFDARGLKELERIARAAADAAAAVHLEHTGRFTAASAVEKGASDFVSEVDLEAQAAALAVIRDRYPDHRILAEEETPAEEARHPDRGQQSNTTPVWIVDPLDGTTNYLHGHPMYCASVGVVVEGRPVAGAVTAPATGERWWARAGGGAWKSDVTPPHGGRRGPRAAEDAAEAARDAAPGAARSRSIAVSPLRDFRKSLIGTGFPFKKLDHLPEYLGQLDRVLRATSGTRRGGSAALDLCYLAEGVFEGFWELWLSPWDIAAGAAIILEAGGIITRLDGSRLDIETPGGILAGCSPDVMRKLAEVLEVPDS